MKTLDENGKMQPSALWRRGVVLPLSAEAADSVRGWAVDETTAVEYLPLATEAACSELFALGLISGINEACGSLIGDYESECLQPHQFTVAEKVIREWHRRWPTGESGEFAAKLLALIGRARELGQPLYFVF